MEGRIRVGNIVVAWPGSGHGFHHSRMFLVARRRAVRRRVAEGGEIEERTTWVLSFAAFHTLEEALAHALSLPRDEHVEVRLPTARRTDPTQVHRVLERLLGIEKTTYVVGKTRTPWARRSPSPRTSSRLAQA